MFKDRRLSKRQIDQWDRATQQRQSLQENSIPDDPQSHWVWLRNDSGAARERFECMALSDPIFNLELDGSVDLMFKAIASAADETPVILLEPIASGAFGKGIIHGLALAKVGSGSTSATTATPGTHKLTPGTGAIKLLGSPSASVDTLLPVLLGASGNSGGSTKHAARMTSAWSTKAASCQIYTLSSASLVYLENATVYDPLSVFASLTTDDWLYVTNQGGVYYASDNASCSGTSPLIESPPESAPTEESE